MTVHVVSFGCANCGMLLPGGRTCADLPAQSDAEHLGNLNACLLRQVRTAKQDRYEALTELKLFARGYDLRGKLLAAYRLGRRPSEKTLDGLRKVADALAANEAARMERMR